MDRRSRHRVHVLVIALLLALGMGAWPIHAATMAPAIAPDAAQLQGDHCPGCDADGHAGAHPGPCQTVCGPATLPIADAAPPPSTAEDRLRQDALLPCGRIIGLDPGPRSFHPRLTPDLVGRRRALPASDLFRRMDSAPSS